MWATKPTDVHALVYSELQARGVPNTHGIVHIP